MKTAYQSYTVGEGGGYVFYFFPKMKIHNIILQLHCSRK